MRNVKAIILLGFGVFFIALAPLLRFYALPQLEKQPLDFSYTDVARGQGTYFDVGSLRIAGPETLTASRTERGDVSAGTSDVAVWGLFTNVANASGTTIDASRDRWAFDRKTGESLRGYGSLPHTGQYLVWPFNAQKKTYQYWDPTAKRAFPARYVRTEKLQGHTVYRYTSVIAPMKTGSLDVPGSLIGLKNRPSVTVDEYYSNPNSSALVDQRTGAVLGGSSHQVRTLRLPGTTKDLLTVLDVNLVATPASVAGLIKKANDGAKQLQLIGVTLPIVALVLGLVLVGTAIWWDRRREVVVLPQAAGGPLAPATAPVPTETSIQTSTQAPPPGRAPPGSPPGSPFDE